MKANKNQNQLNFYKSRMEWMHSYLGGKCVRCSSKENLEIDHIDFNLKSFNLSTAYSYSKDTLLVELDKCQLLCSECHLHKTREEDGFKADYIHGNYSMYRRGGCRCDECKQANRDMVRAWRLSKKENAILPC